MYEDSEDEYGAGHEGHLQKTESHSCDCFCQENENEMHCPPGEVPHHCTDLPCLLLFGAAIFGFCQILSYCQANGDLRRITHGYDFLGNLCGIDGFASQPRLFWCADPFNPMTLDWDHPICRDSCPTGNEKTNPCFWRAEQSKPQTLAAARIPGSGLDVKQSFLVETNYIYRNVSDYKAKDVFGRYCFPDPEGNAVSKALYSNLQDKLKQTPGYTWLMKAASVKHSWQLLVCAVAMSVILGFAYLILLKCFACVLVWASLLIITVACLSFGGYVTYMCFTDDNKSSDNNWAGLDGLPSTGDSTWDGLFGVVILIVGFAFGCLTCCAHSAINTAIGIVEAACECMWSLPSL